jgi:uncharacterized Ntn-hydrolase superfamily protein
MKPFRPRVRQSATINPGKAEPQLAAEPPSSPMRSRSRQPGYPGRWPMQGTFSIVGMDPLTREWGVGVASRVVDVGYIVPWLKAEVGAVATQALSNPYLGPYALEALESGQPAATAMETILARDASPEVRQVGLVDANGESAAHTGRETLDYAGHRTAPYVAVQGNILVGPEVVESMLQVFQECRGPLGERLMAALEAGQQAGGDKRGRQSAALKVVRSRGGYDGVDDRLVDLKVVDNPEPLTELRRQYSLWQFAFLVPAYCRLADEEADHRDLFLQAVGQLLDVALASNLRDAEAFNSLAWHLAIRKQYPRQTLLAAQRAQELSPQDANILDTLAEAHFAAGDATQAVYWEEQALAQEPESGLFRQQLDRFRDAQTGAGERSGSPA